MVRRGSPLLLSALVLFVFGCADHEAAASGARPGQALRVVSLHDVTTELMIELGAGALLCGVNEPVDLEEAVALRSAAVPRVSSLESIVALRPDLVLGLGVVAEREPELVARLRQAGIEVQLWDPATLDDVAELTRWMGARVGAEARAQALLATLSAGAAADGRPRAEPLRVFVYDCCDPPFTAGGKTVLSDLIARAGGRNLFGELDADWTHVSWEEVALRKPELIVVHAYDYDGQGDVADKRRALAAMPGLGSVPTTVLPLGCSLGGLRSLEGLARLRTAIGAQP
jgi:iron complex transport system substrate-binding protein